MQLQEIYNSLFFLMIRRPPRSTQAHTLFPYTTLFRSLLLLEAVGVGAGEGVDEGALAMRSEEHTSELQSRELISYAVFCLKKKKRWCLSELGMRSRLRQLAPTLSTRRGVIMATGSRPRPSPVFFFFNETATTEIYTSSHTLSLHDALPISPINAMMLALSCPRRGAKTGLP